MKDRARLLLLLASAVPAAACGDLSDADSVEVVTVQQALTLDRLPNNLPIPNDAGTAATYSTRGFVDLTTPFHRPLGTNGRSCGSCHFPTAGWNVRPLEAQVVFALTNGTDPLYRTPEANNPMADVSTVAARRVAYSMLREKALFRRTFAIPAGAEFDVIAFNDPYGVATSTKLSLFRRPLTTANLHLINGVAWENRTGAADGDLHAGLIAQASGNVTGAQQGTMLPPPEVLEEIVSWETALSHAQLSTFGAGRLDRCGARGGPEYLSAQARVAGRFDIFDAWIGLAPGACTGATTDRKRAQIARGQELFNNHQNATGGTCRGCHNVANNGTNFNGILFDVGASAGSRRTPDMPVYTLHNLTTGETRESTDPGRAMITGKWVDVDRFKAPTLRGIASRGPYFHNGIAATLSDVVHHYEDALGFNFTASEEADLVAFLSAL